jgi:hypothetical protein
MQRTIGKSAPRGVKRFAGVVSALLLGTGTLLISAAAPASADPSDCETDFVNSVRTSAVCFYGFGEYRAYVQCSNGSTYYATTWTRVDDYSYAQCPAGRGIARVAGVVVR